ncbi:hypothetical protein SBA2_410033 [Acidobacteriia bacterium SbA2]|nr:hypothetical protein SBA2_410033 [Acidobacteriia bacterium SbA2]
MSSTIRRGSEGAAGLGYDPSPAGAERSSAILMHRDHWNVALRPAWASHFVVFGCDTAAPRYVRGPRR